MPEQYPTAEAASAYAAAREEGRDREAAWYAAYDASPYTTNPKAHADASAAQDAYEKARRAGLQVPSAEARDRYASAKQEGHSDPVAWVHALIVSPYSDQDDAIADATAAEAAYYKARPRPQA